MAQFPASSSAQLKADLISRIPKLRAFAMSLCGNADRADDLVQETLAKAWGKLDSFVEGTDLGAWLFTILRNGYFSEFRKRRREVSDSEGKIVGRVAVAPGQDIHMDMLDFRAALAQLSAEQREALILIGAAGYSYDEAAEICCCAVGTIKSRVNRGRGRLAEMLFIHSGVKLAGANGAMAASRRTRKSQWTAPLLCWGNQSRVESLRNGWRCG